MTKMDAVRKALEVGKEKPADGVAYILEQFQVEIAPQMFSAYKTHLKKHGETSGRGRRTGGKVGDPAELARKVKELVDQYGAKTVSNMLGVFSD